MVHIVCEKNPLTEYGVIISVQCLETVFVVNAK